MKTKTAPHTPTPWKIETDPIYANAGTLDITRGRTTIASVLVDLEPGAYLQKDVWRRASPEERADAEFIVRAVNSHEALLECVRRADKFIRARDAAAGEHHGACNYCEAIAQAEGKV